MKRQPVIEHILLPIIELTGLIGIFWLAYSLRQVTDGIPFIQLRIPYIARSDFSPFIPVGVGLWALIFASRGLYQSIVERPIIDTIRATIMSAIFWFLIYIGFVYLTTGFLYQKEIPRLIIVYVFFLATIFAVFLRVWLQWILWRLIEIHFIEKSRILVIGEKKEWEKYLRDKHVTRHIYRKPSELIDILDMIRKKDIDMILLLAPLGSSDMEEVIELCSIYGITLALPQILPKVYHISHREGFIWGMPVIESHAVSMTPWERVIKRTFDIIISIFLLILLLPLFLLIAIAIKLEDPSGPVIFRNRRIWISWREFFLYKFRYMYWIYSVKDAYGVDQKDDSAIQYEEELKKKSDVRSWPLYKIQNDPRKTHVWRWIEKFSLDELPQLWNVFKGEMSLVWPRPHQPREIEHYREHHYQVLTVKPWITGMAQVSGREKNSFEDEVTFDVYYIEHYSLLLDILILLKTSLVVIGRSLEK